MSGDDDEDDKITHRKSRAPSAWGDDERADVGRRHRTPPSGASLESERSAKRREHKASRTHPHGIPIPDAVEREFGGTGEVEHEVTEPIEVLRRSLEPEDREIIDRLRRDSDDPIIALFAGQLNLSNELRKLKIGDRSERRDQANQILELIKHPPHEAVLELQEDVQRIWRAFAEIGKQIGQPHTESRGKGTVWEVIHRSQTAHRIAKAVATAALTVALGSVGYVVSSIRASATEEVLRAQDRQEIKDLRRDLQRLKEKTP